MSAPPAVSGPSTVSRPLAGEPVGSLAVPERVERLAAGVPVRAVWLNEAGGSTWELARGEDRRFVKWAPAESGLDLGAEAERLSWAGQFVTVPRVLEYGADAAGAWLVTAALEGESAVSRRWRADPLAAARGIGRGLRMLHDGLPVDGCPFAWRSGAQLEPAPAPADRLVVCHGDACAPNTLLKDDGTVAGHVDLGHLGVGDPWSDLAIATWSTEWNYGPGFEDALLDAYGIGPDPERTIYYRTLWDLG